MNIINRTKYNVDKDTIKRTFDGEIYDSITEMKYFRDYVLPRMRSGEIISCERQVKYELQPKFEYQGKTIQPITYVADFVITENSGDVIVIDIKGCPDSASKIKAKLMKYKYPDIDYRWICYSLIDGGWVLFETVQKGRTERKKIKNK